MSATADLTQRVAALEQAIAGLQGSEALQPNYLTVSPTGQVGAKFSGAISASELDLIAGASPSPIKWVTSAGAMVAELTGDAAGNLTLQASSLAVSSGAGLDLPAGVTAGTPTPSSKLNWINPSGVLTTADLWASDTNGGNQEPVMVMETSPLGDLAEIYIAANTGGSGTTFNPQNQALLHLHSNNNPAGSWIIAQAMRGGGGAGGPSVRIIDDTGASGFVFNRSAQGALAISAGQQGAMSFNTSGQSINMTITHGLGRPPIAVAATVISAPSFAAIPVFNWFSATSTTFGINAVKPNFSDASTITFSWIAIG